MINMHWSNFDQHVTEYKTAVDNTLDELADLKEQAHGFSESIQVHEDARELIEDCDRKRGHLLGEREVV